jgi:hypothetical protein
MDPNLDSYEIGELLSARDAITKATHPERYKEICEYIEKCRGGISAEEKMGRCPTCLVRLNQENPRHSRVSAIEFVFFGEIWSWVILVIVTGIFMVGYWPAAIVAGIVGYGGAAYFLSREKVGYRCLNCKKSFFKRAVET